MPDELSIPIMPHKQIELWDITLTSGNFHPYQIQTANIHFSLNSDVFYNTKYHIKAFNSCKKFMIAV